MRKRSDFHTISRVRAAFRSEVYELLIVGRMGAGFVKAARSFDESSGSRSGRGRRDRRVKLALKTVVRPINASRAQGSRAHAAPPCVHARSTRSRASRMRAVAAGGDRQVLAVTRLDVKNAKTHPWEVQKKRRANQKHLLKFAVNNALASNLSE
ncbi:hypothetical protein EVAR_85841_1 [Eumeta japonica]|uniref:Uncharacterized protein n=1 Tax=Eumeta variegata TaxID=151549 RepID=A0A4C1URP2_EUMVA|nr:hypothetical protein EVAR_85841_1 [Eumeta japonica]